MSQQHRGDGWTAEVDGSIMVWEFLPGMELSSFEDAYPVFEELLSSNSIDAMVTHVKLEDPFNDDVFDIWEQSAQRAEAAGVERWAVVADGIKALSLRGKVNTGDLETFTTESHAEAMEWVRQ